MNGDHLIKQRQDTDTLFFCYNIKDRNILYKSQALESFFGYLAAEEQSIPIPEADWKTCLSLKENEAKEFSFRSPNVNVEPERLFSCRIEARTDHNGSSLLFGTVVKSGGPGHPQTDSSLHFQKAYEEFIHLAAHDLDAPLRKLSVLYERLIGATESGKDISDYKSRIDSCLSDMRAMIDGLTRLSVLQPPVVIEQFEMAEVIGISIADLQKKYKDKDINIRYDRLPALQGDRNSMTELFTQLIGNAILFSKNGNAEIVIEAGDVTPAEKKEYRLSSERKYVAITIKDNGIGFQQKDAENIFKPFVRLNGRSAYPGAGIGLAICKKIVENHHGIIYAAGQENDGAQFVLFLPQTFN